jgi:hypothetical protein
MDVSMSGSLHGWALAEDRDCGESTCLVVLSTGDGGASWSWLTAIPVCELPDVVCTTDTPPLGTGVRFVNRRIGYVYGQVTMMTTDGGRTWNQQNLKDVVGMASAGKAMVAVQSQPISCPGCEPQISMEWSEPGSTTWQDAQAQGMFGQNTPAPELPMATGGDVYVTTMPPPPPEGSARCRPRLPSPTTAARPSTRGRTPAARPARTPSPT